MADIKAEYLACPIRQVVSDDGLFPEDALADTEESGAESPCSS